MKKHIHHIELSHTSLNLSGGEKALIESAKFLTNFPNIVQTIYTSETGIMVYKKLLSSSADNINFVEIGSKKMEEFNHYIAYFSRVPLCILYVRKFSKNEEHIIFSHEEFLPTTIFSFLLKILNPIAKWVVFFHMKSPSLFKGYEGEYVNKYHFPSIFVARYKIEQSIFYFLTKRLCDKVLTVNECYREFLDKIYRKYSKPVYVIKRYSGVKVPESTIHEKKVYDLSFMARFHEQKGLFEVIDIIEKLKKVKPNISIVMMGGGVKRIEDKFFELVKRKNLESNIIYKGYIIGDEKFNTLKQSKIFLFPSYYESFGQVALESMKCGLPVVAYNLPPFAVFKKGMIKVPILDNEKMTEEILKLLNDYNYYENIIDEGRKFALEFSWEKTSLEIYEQILF